MWQLFRASYGIRQLADEQGRRQKQWAPLPYDSHCENCWWGKMRPAQCMMTSVLAAPPCPSGPCSRMLHAQGLDGRSHAILEDSQYSRSGYACNAPTVHWQEPAASMLSMCWFGPLHHRTNAQQTSTGLTVVLPQQLLHRFVLESGGGRLSGLAWGGLRVGVGAWGRIRCCCCWCSCGHVGASAPWRNPRCW